MNSDHTLHKKFKKENIYTAAVRINVPTCR